MIVELVTFPTADTLSRDKEYEGARHSAALWVKNPDLIAKHFIRDEDNHGGAIYIWPSVADAKRHHNAGWLADFEKRMGCTPKVQYFELMMTADPKGGKVIEFGVPLAAAAE